MKVFPFHRQRFAATALLLAIIFLHSACEHTRQKEVYVRIGGVVLDRTRVVLKMDNITMCDELNIKKHSFGKDVIFYTLKDSIAIQLSVGSKDTSFTFVTDKSKHFLTVGYSTFQKEFQATRHDSAAFKEFSWGSDDTF